MAESGNASVSKEESVHKDITLKKLKKYFEITESALEKAKTSKSRIILKSDGKDAREDFIDMIERYVSDARHFMETGNWVDAFAALNYAHGWLDAGARIGIFDVHDSRLFTAD